MSFKDNSWRRSLFGDVIFFANSIVMCADDDVAQPFNIKDDC